MGQKAACASTIVINIHDFRQKVAEVDQCGRAIRDILAQERVEGT